MTEFIQQSVAPHASFAASPFIGIIERKNWSAEEMNILQNTLPARKCDIKTKHDSLSPPNVSQNQTYDKMDRISRKRDLVTC